MTEYPAGLQLDRYRVVQVLGQGSFGITYKAFDQLLQRFVAIKEFFLYGSQRVNGNVIFPSEVSFEHVAQMRAGFLEEARALARFSDAGVVRVNEVFEENQTSYIVMEFIEGRTLEDYASSQNGLSGIEVLRLAKSLLRSLSRVHDLSLLHRDIKPANVYITSEGQPVLIDFGAARSMQSNADMTVILTPHFAPIEQYGTSYALGTYTDIYALAATLVSTFYGDLVPTAPDRVQNDTFKLRVPSDAPLALTEALTRALIVSPAQRLQNANEFLALLEGQGLVQFQTSLDQKLEAYRNTQLQTLLELFSKHDMSNEPKEKLEIFVHFAVVALVCLDVSKPIPSAPVPLAAFVGNLIAGVTGSFVEILENADVDDANEFVLDVAAIGLAFLSQEEAFAKYVRNALLEGERQRKEFLPIKREWRVEQRFLKEKPNAVDLETAFPDSGQNLHSFASDVAKVGLTERGHFLTLLGSVGSLDVLHVPSATSRKLLGSSRLTAVAGGGAGLWVARDDRLERLSLTGEVELTLEIGEPVTALAVGAHSVAIGTKSGRVGWLKDDAMTWFKDQNPNNLAFLDPNPKSIEKELNDFHKTPILEVAFSNDERIIVSTAINDPRAVIIRTDKKTKLREITLLNTVARVSIEPGGRMLTTLSEDGEVSIWDIPSGALRRQLLTHNPVIDIAMLAYGRLAVLTKDSTVLLYQALSAQVIACEDIPASLKARQVLVDPKGSLLCVIGEENLLTWQLAALTSEEMQTPTQLIGLAGTTFKSIPLDSKPELETLVQPALRTLDPLKRKLELYRTELLDLGNRNPLLNFQPRDQRGRIKAKRLILEDVTADDLYQHLVIEGKGITFESTLQSNEEDEDDTFIPRASAAKRGDLKVNVKMTAGALQNRLTELYRTAQEFIDEQGINCFFMVLGAIGWRDRKDPLLARQAPLILVPVALTRDRQGGGFRLTYNDEDIESNQAFALKLRLEGLDLPSIGEEEDLIPSEYAARVTQGLSAGYGPVMLEQVYLGFFSFAKLLMYRDLDTTTWAATLELSKHPILAPLLSDEVNPTPLLPPEPARLEMVVRPSETGHVLDADYSQSQAVLLAAEGHHLVIEGPPGTGKSQTITNIIAALVAKGKRVLFVAEKEAALSVVENRLQAIGLGEAMLSLHSKDANKTALRDQLQRAYNQPRINLSQDLGKGQQLDQISTELREIEMALHEPILESGFTPYELYGFIRASTPMLEGRNTPPLTTGTEFSWNRPRFENALHELDLTQKWLAQYGSPQNLAFYGSSRTSWLPTDDAQTKTLVQRALQALNALESSLETLPNDVPRPNTQRETNDLAAVFLEIESLNLPFGIRPELVAWDNWGDSEYNIIKNGLHRNEIRLNLEPLMLMEAWDTDTDYWISVLEGLIFTQEAEIRWTKQHLQGAWNELERGEDWQYDATHSAGNDPQVKTLVAQSLQALNALEKTFAKLPSDVPRPQTQRELNELATLLQEIEVLNLPIGLRPELVAWDEWGDKEDKTLKHGIHRQDIRSRLESQLRPEAWDTDTSQWIEIFEKDGSKWYAFLLRQVSNAKKSLTALHHDPLQARRNNMLDVAKQISYDRRSRAELEQFAVRGKTLFGITWKAQNSDFKQLQNAVRSVKELRLNVVTGLIPSWHLSLYANSSDQQQVVKSFLACQSELSNSLEAVQRLLALKPLENMGIQQFEDATWSQWKIKLELYNFLLNQVSNAKTAIAGLFRDPAKAHQKNLLEVAKEISYDRKSRAELTQFTTQGRALFGTTWKAENSDFGLLEIIVKTVKQLRLNVVIGLTPEWHLSLYETASEQQRIAQTFLNSCNELKTSLETLQQHLALKLESLGVTHFEDVTWEQWNTKLEIYTMKSQDFRHSIEWNQFETRLTDLGLIQCVKAVSWTDASRLLTKGFALEVHNLFLSKAFETRNALARFSSTMQNDRVAQFQALDKALIVLNRERILHSYQQNLPVASSAGQVGVLRQEFARQKRLKPIRTLMQEAGLAIQALKPVFMMSPLSVASFLPLGTLEFDVVLFDEASQVRPADALGALLRAKQAIVVGDPKQLGPSNFFQKTSGDDPESELEGASLLDLFMSRFEGNKRSLTWHYRSQHQSLIQTSNEMYYKNQLVTFPSALERSSELGLVYHHLPNTFYESGDKKRVNRLEAEEVVKAVLRHAEHRTHESLMVVTFNLPQKKEIERLLDKLATTNQLSETQRKFLEPPEPKSESKSKSKRKPKDPDRFVVKNIENVQGDERDVIMISVGSGFDNTQPKRKLHARFGPLAQQDGWRRLNVLITRAKRRCEVFVNFLPHELKDRSNGGMPGFQRFLELAHNKTETLKLEQHETRDALIGDIANFLHGAGFEVETMIGSDALSIDLAVKHPSGNGYLLGIDVDSANEVIQMKSSRDMHRLRPEVLAKLGWRLHRIWSTDWFRAPQEQRTLLVEKLETLKLEPVIPVLPMPELQTTPALPESTVTLREAITEVLPNLLHQNADVQAILYKVFDQTLYNGNIEFYQIAENYIAKWILDILQVEHPIHSTILTKRLANKTGNTRVGGRIATRCNEVFALGAHKGLWLYEHDTLSIPNEPVPIRTRASLPVSEKQFDLVPLLELETAVRHVVQHSLGVQRLELEAVIPRILGFDRVTEGMAQTMQTALNKILQYPDFVLQGDYITIQLKS
jgi:serine/threonine protein kinase/DNA polymerase III delta prime subunit